jgi:hypothetical protein
MAVGADDCMSELHLIGVWGGLGKQQSGQAESCGHARHAGDESQDGPIGPRWLGPNR